MAKRPAIKLRRYGCDALAELRTCDKTKNYAHLLGLVEETQYHFNRMEAGLEASRTCGGKIMEVTIKKDLTDKQKIVAIVKLLKKRYEFTEDGSFPYFGDVV